MPILINKTTGEKIRTAYRCKICKSEVSPTYLWQHYRDKHFDHCYMIVEYNIQSRLD